MLVNHKPDLAGNSAETRITPSPSSELNRYHLAIKADDSGSNFLYSGTQQPSESYALLYNPINQTFTLDRVSTDFTFNLRSTPTIKSSKALASAYPHLYTGVSDPESSSDEPLEENDLDPSGADPNNPYDYRHFLKRRRTSSSVTPDLPALTPALTPALPPRRTAPRPKPAPRTARPPPKHAPSPPPREEADADNEESDDGGLTIEFDPVTKPSRLKNAFSYDTSNGPISLRSVASSASPADMEGRESIESDEDEDVEEMQLEENGVEIMQAPDEEPEDDEEDDDENDHHNDDEDYDGSLEAELEQALGAQAGEDINGTLQDVVDGVETGTEHGLGIAGVGSAVRINNNPILDESSSESEEE